MTNSPNTLSDDETAALNEALDDEYKALATYEQVIADFGEIRPFINIAESEGRHIDALRGCFERYGVTVPESSWEGRAPRFNSVGEACRAGVDAEVENGAMYDRLLQSTERADLIEVLQNLQRASQENHLAAFQRCADRSDGGGRGRRLRGRP